MKKKHVAVILCVAMLSASLCGCAGSSDTSATTTPSEPAVAVEKEEPEVTEPVQVEEPKEEVPEEKEATEGEEGDSGKVEEPKAEGSTEEVAEADTKSSDADDTTEAKEEAAQGKSEEKVSEAARLFNEYIADGDFKEAEQYGKDLGADYIRFDEKLIIYNFGSWFIQISGGGQDTERAYFAIGEWQTTGDVANTCTYSCEFEFGEGMKVLDDTEYSVQALNMLPDTLDYMFGCNDPNTKPEGIPGDWKACEPTKPWIQH